MAKRQLNTDATPKRKRAPAKKKRVQDATNLFINQVKETGEPVPIEMQLVAHAETKPRSTHKGSLEEFNQIMSRLKRQLAHKGVNSIEDL